MQLYPGYCTRRSKLFPNSIEWDSTNYSPVSVYSKISNFKSVWDRDSRTGSVLAPKRCSTGPSFSTFLRCVLLLLSNVKTLLMGLHILVKIRVQLALKAYLVEKSWIFLHLHIYSQNVNMYLTCRYSSAN